MYNQEQSTELLEAKEMFKNGIEGNFDGKFLKEHTLNVLLQYNEISQEEKDDYKNNCLDFVYDTYKKDIDGEESNLKIASIQVLLDAGKITKDQAYAYEMKRKGEVVTNATAIYFADLMFPENGTHRLTSKGLDKMVKDSLITKEQKEEYVAKRKTKSQSTSRGRSIDVPEEGVFVPKFENGKQARIPIGYSMSKLGIYKVTETGELVKIASAPLWLSKKHNVLGGDEIRYTVTTVEFGKKYETTVSREELRTSAKLLGRLSIHQGFSIHEANKVDIMKFLAEFEDYNNNAMPFSTATIDQGWRTENGEFSGFTLGKKYFKKGNKEEELDIMETVGLDKYEAEGEEEEWAELLTYVKNYPGLAFPLCASVASPLLTPLEEKHGFVLEIVGEKGSGKTTALQLAQSVWGKASMEDVESSNSTPISIEISAATQRHLPLLLDEVGQYDARRLSADALVYLVTNMHDKSRGQKEVKRRKSRTFKLITIFSGEKSLVSRCNVGGAQTRTLTYVGRPLGKESSENALAARKIDKILRNNHGFLGESIVKMLVDFNEEDWDDLKEIKENQHARIMQLAEKSPMGASDKDRRAGFMSNLYVAATLIVAQSLSYGKIEEKDLFAALDAVWLDISNVSLSEMNPSVAAMEDFRLWTIQEHYNFSLKCDTDYLKQRRQVGREVEGGLAVVPSALKDFLTKKGFDPKVTFADWVRKGWMLGADNSFTPTLKSIRFSKDTKVHAYVITTQAFDEICPDVDEQDKIFEKRDGNFGVV